MARRGGVATRLREVAEDRLGVSLIDSDDASRLREAAEDGRRAALEAERLAYLVLNNASWESQDADPKERRKLSKEARTAWARDPQAGAANDLMNDFVFGRGVPKPRFKDPLVQGILDEAWDDPDNQLTLTSYQAQLGLGTDLNLQSNVLLLEFDGDDGRIKLALLEHDTVDDAVRDEEYRLRPLFYKTFKKTFHWDYNLDQLKAVPEGQPKVVYYEHWRNVDDAEEAGRVVRRPPAVKMGEGRVYHVAINRTGEMVFGMPTMRRLLRWFSAYNEFMVSRVDIMKAAAAFLMKRKVTGGEKQVLKAAEQTLSREGPLGASSAIDGGRDGGPTSVGSTLVENEAVAHEPFSIPTNAGQAAQDAQMLRAMISAASRFPQSYFGDASNSNLATATSLELPVLKAVESRQEVWEGVFRWFIDRVTQRAVESGRIPETLAEEELVEYKRRRTYDHYKELAKRTPPTSGEEFPAYRERLLHLAEAYEEQGVDEEATERDLSYEFSMPSPLRRMLPDLTGAVATTARTFDPNGTNVELSRVLLNIILGEGFEVEDPADLVEKIFPEGYQDPALAAFQAQQQQQPPPGEEAPPGGAEGADGDRHTEDNPYGAPQRSRPPEKVVREAEFTEMWDEDLRGGIIGELEAAEGRLLVTSNGHH